MAKAVDPGEALIETIRAGLPVGVELDEREETLLGLAAGQARDVERAEADLAKRGYLVPGASVSASPTSTSTWSRGGALPRRARSTATSARRRPRGMHRAGTAA